MRNFSERTGSGDVMMFVWLFPMQNVELEFLENQQHHLGFQRGPPP
jgi:hypothetical protein